MMPLRYSTATRLITADNSAIVGPGRVMSLSKTSGQQSRVNVSAECELNDANEQLQSPSQENRPGTEATGCSVLDELVSWRRLKEPLERYSQFVCCNYFCNADQPTDAQQLEDDGSGTNSDNVGLSVSVSKTQKDDERLLQRPRTEPCRITWHIARYQSSDGSDCG